MKIALILDPAIIDDLPRRDRLVETLRHTKGILGLDVEMADSGLLLANVNKSMETKILEELEGIERNKAEAERKAQLKEEHVAARKPVSTDGTARH